MFFVVSKIAKVFILPLTWVLLLLVVSHFIKNKKWRRGTFVAAIAMLLVFSNKPLLDWSRYMTTRQYSHQKLPKKYYNVAVVMGGFGSIDSASTQITYLDDRGARLWEAIRLYESGVVDKLLITGDATSSIDANGHSTADVFRDYVSDFGIHENDLLLEQHARNTRENARYSIAMLDSMEFSSEQCLLVTSATHIKRSHSCFEKLGWDMDVYATNVYPKPHPNAIDFIPRWRTLTDWHELLNEWVGNVVYKIVGY